MRSVIRILLLLGIVLLVSPFLISSLLIDQRGVLITGHVFSKDERIVVRNASWTRNMDISVQYDPPDGYGGVAFMSAQLTPDRFDRLKKGDLVQLHYLLAKDLPAFPGAKTMRQMHVLPMVRLADEQTWSGPAVIVDSHRTLVSALLAAVLILVLWRLFRVPYFGSAVFLCIVVAIAISMVADFPKAMPAPKNDVRMAAGTIKSLERWEWLFRDNRSQGLKADQPIQVAGVQFVPEGRTEPVVAVDLIDEGSLPGLREHAPVRLEYESAAPRVAYIRGATRHFFGQNVLGVVNQGVAVVVVTAILLAVGGLLRFGFGRLTRRRTT